jgi:hypothetical protein
VAGQSGGLFTVAGRVAGSGAGTVLRIAPRVCTGGSAAGKVTLAGYSLRLYIGSV